jgi:hypothetical protein
MIRSLSTKAAIVLTAGLLSSWSVNGADISEQLGSDVNGVDFVENLYNNSSAFVITIGNYEHWSKLQNLPLEAQNVVKELTLHRFIIKEEKDLSENDFRRAFDRFIDEHGLEEKDRIVVFFGGHGWSDKNSGFLVPADAPDPFVNKKAFLQKSIPMTQIVAWAREMRARHVLFVFDSCFSGSIFQSRNQDSSKAARLTDAVGQPVRQFITSGSKSEEVPAESVFTPIFVRGLQGQADYTKDGYVTGHELGLYVRAEMTEYGATQTPQYGKIRDIGLDEGDIVFRVRQQAEEQIAQINDLTSKDCSTRHAMFEKSLPNIAMSPDARMASKQMMNSALVALMDGRTEQCDAILNGLEAFLGIRNNRTIHQRSELSPEEIQNDIDHNNRITSKDRPFFGKDFIDLTPAEIIGMNVVDPENRTLGDIDDVVRSARDGRLYVVISVAEDTLSSKEKVLYPLMFLRTTSSGMFVVETKRDATLAALPRYDHPSQIYSKTTKEINGSYVIDAYGREIGEVKKVVRNRNSKELYVVVEDEERRAPQSALPLDQLTPKDRRPDGALIIVSTIDYSIQYDNTNFTTIDYSDKLGSIAHDQYEELPLDVRFADYFNTQPRAGASVER